MIESSPMILRPNKRQIRKRINWPAKIEKLRQYTLKSKGKPSWDIYLPVCDRLKMLPEEHLYKSYKIIRIENELLAESKMIDEETIILDADIGLTNNEMLQIIIHRENQNYDKAKSKESLKSMPIKGLIDIARCLVMQSNDNQLIYKMILENYGKKLRSKSKKEKD